MRELHHWGGEGGSVAESSPNDSLSFIAGLQLFSGRGGGGRGSLNPALPAPLCVTHCRTLSWVLGPCGSFCSGLHPHSIPGFSETPFLKSCFAWVPLVPPLDQNVCHRSSLLTAQHLNCLGRNIHTPNEQSGTKALTSLCISLITKSLKILVWCISHKK